jgi:hypothetical protein
VETSLPANRLTGQPINHQLALVTPGISPREASSLKHILQSLNLLIKPLGLPHSIQRLYARTLNLGFFFCFSINAFFANFYSFSTSPFKSQTYRCGFEEIML